MLEIRNSTPFSELEDEGTKLSKEEDVVGDSAAVVKVTRYFLPQISFFRVTFCEPLVLVI
jgi:hypothetical protein